MISRIMLSLREAADEEQGMALGGPSAHSIHDNQGCTSGARDGILLDTLAESLAGDG